MDATLNVSCTGAGYSTFSLPNNPLRIGKYEASNYFNGLIDEVRIRYNYSASAEEINATFYNIKEHYLSLGGQETESPAQTYVNETIGREAILAGIYNSSASSATIYTSQQIYARNMTDGQVLGRFDEVAAYGSQRWAFNYVTDGEIEVNMFNLTPVLFTLEMTNKTGDEIRNEVENLINTTMS